MAVDLQEDKMINEYIAEVKAKQEGTYVDKGSKMSQTEIDEEFDNLDLTQFNKDE